MTEGLVHPCLDLGDSPEHRLLYWMGQRARQRDGVLVRDPEDVLSEAARRVFGSGNSMKLVPWMRTLIDCEFIEKTEVGPHYRWKVLVTCPGEKFSGELSPVPHAAGGRSVSLAAKPLEWSDPEDRSGSDRAIRRSLKTNSISGRTTFRQRSVQTPVKELSNLFYARTLHRGMARPGEMNWKGFGGAIKAWIENEDMDVWLIRRMINEFVRHPQWVNNSKNNAWKVFIIRRDDLTAILSTQQRRDPSASKSRFGHDYLNGRRQPQHA